MCEMGEDEEVEVEVGSYSTRDSSSRCVSLSDASDGRDAIGDIAGVQSQLRFRGLDSVKCSILKANEKTRIGASPT